MQAGLAAPAVVIVRRPRGKPPAYPLPPVGRAGVGAAAWLITSLVLVAAPGTAPEYVMGPTVRAQGLAGFLNGQEYARMRIPNRLFRQGAVQRKLLCSDLDRLCLVFPVAFHNTVKSNVS